MKQKISARLVALLLVFALLLTSCAPKAEAATMRLKRTEGTVSVSDGEGRDIAVAADLGLYSGYQVGTQAESYAWIDLDSVKLSKMDADSEVEVVKDGKKLELNVKSGSLFFNVTEPLADDETLDIRTSTMLVGIRGTCGWVTQDSAALLEGTVEVAAGEQSVTVSAGEMAVLTEEGTLEVRPLTAGAVPAFVREEVEEDEKLAETIPDPPESDPPESDSPEAGLPAPYDYWVSRFYDEVLYTEFVDFAGDGVPELLVIAIEIKEPESPEVSERNVVYAVHADASAEVPGALINRHSDMMYSKEYFSSGHSFSRELVWSLVESDGRLFIKRGSTESFPDTNNSQAGVYFESFNDEGIWSVEYVYYYALSRNLIYRYAAWVLDGQSGTFSRDSDAEEFAAVQAKYSEVKRLAYSPDGISLTVVAP